jgi:hypothetical protein
MYKLDADVVYTNSKCPQIGLKFVGQRTFDLAVRDPIDQSGFMYSVLLLPPISAKLRFTVYEPLD